MTSIAAVVFDLDGLLIDSEPLQAWAWDEYVSRFGARLTPEVLRRMLGRRAVDAVEIAIEMLDLPVTGADALRDRDDIFLAAVPGAIAPMDGAPELLAELRARGVPVALATSGHRRYVDLALASAGLSGQFDVEVTGEMVTHGKPHPDTYLQAARMLDMAPERCLALEDAPNGIASAKAAGMLCFAVCADPDSPHDISQADVVLPSLREVIATLGERVAGSG
ncbi:MAG TPA: HAD family phosphatase [Thermomicrobiales bacterium]|nr:HAD family phosphatase [Thermomicrobiales bacterium]